MKAVIPVVSTLLLILIAAVCCLIIYLWIVNYEVYVLSYVNSTTRTLIMNITRTIQEFTNMTTLGLHIHPG